MKAVPARQSAAAPTLPEIDARPGRLAAVGLQITQEDVGYVDRGQENSDAFGKEAR